MDMDEKLDVLMGHLHEAAETAKNVPGWEMRANELTQMLNDCRAEWSSLTGVSTVQSRMPFPNAA